MDYCGNCGAEGCEAGDLCVECFDAQAAHYKQLEAAHHQELETEYETHLNRLYSEANDDFGECL